MDFQKVKDITGLNRFQLEAIQYPDGTFHITLEEPLGLEHRNALAAALLETAIRLGTLVTTSDNSHPL